MGVNLGSTNVYVPGNLLSCTKMPIKRILARQIYDSRGNPTVEVDLTTEKGIFRAAVPSGASTGIYEALELRDKASTWHGKGVTKAVHNVNNLIAPELIKNCLDPVEQTKIDEIMLKLDGTDNKNSLGANAILGVSMAVCKAGSAHKGVPLYRHIADLAGIKDVIMPVPAFNVINGGSHAGNKLAMQEFMVLPTGAPTFSEAMRMGSELYHHLKKIINSKYGLDATAVGDEGGFAPNFQDNNEALELIQEAIKKSGYEGKIKIGMDVAASEFCKDGKYDLDFKNPNSNVADYITSDQLCDMYQHMIEKYPIVSIEDPFDQDDWAGWTKLTAHTVTNPKRIQMAVDRKSCNPSSSRSTRSAPSPSPSPPTTWPRPTAGAPWPPTGPARLRTASSPTWWWDSLPARSRLVRPAGRSDRPSTTSCLGLRKSSAATPSSPERSSVTLSKVSLPPAQIQPQDGSYFSFEDLHQHPELHLLIS